MVIQQLDGSLVREHEPPRQNSDKQTFYTEVSPHHLDGLGDLIDRLFNFALDVLDARHIELRVYDPE